MDTNFKKTDYDLEVLNSSEEISDLQFEILDRKENQSCAECGRSYTVDGYYHPSICEKCSLLGVVSYFTEEEYIDMFDISVF